MKRLAIWDVDDTLVMIDTTIGVKDPDGNVVENITASEYYERAATGELSSDDCCFMDYGCAQTFYDEGVFNPFTRGVIKEHLANPDIDVFFITGRSNPSCLDTYMRKFHEEGVDIDPDHVIFAAQQATGEERTHTDIMKRPYYEHLVGLGIYDKVVGFEDNPRNLKALYYVCLDYDIPFEGYLVDRETHTFTRFTAAHLAALGERNEHTATRNPTST